ncbi:hypothetical protein [Clostridium estertheticum]|uniref:hypothetical protein n=1 Tax=Clostridium estertheticum TaxID=238834 RepID=UPI001CCBF093|nr:hypothetical protein [Clostridium estertheticum]MBZ9616777.1 hypothetical protein [Clostridium estertheticum subsp. laramiense]WAG72484.1 hypothetical protein LL032_15165 [Clostridium estertheticum]
MNKNVQILNIEAKDILDNKCYIVDKTTKDTIDLLRKNDFRILSRYKGSMDYSLLTIYLQKISKKIIKVNKSTKRLYSNDFITVKFNYALTDSSLLEIKEIEECCNLNVLIDVLKAQRDELNKTRLSLIGKIKRLYAKDLIDRDIDKMTNCAKELTIIENKIKDIDAKVKIKDAKKKITAIKKGDSLSTKELRNEVYENGFDIIVNGKNTHYCRFLRSSGSARSGKVNFCNEIYYSRLIKWCMSGIQYKNNNELDLPSLESYLALITSSIISTFSLKPENILLIDEKFSTFTDTVMATELINGVYEPEDIEKKNPISGDLFTSVKKKKISNNLFDGEAMLSKEIFIEKGYEDKAILQIRNKFYKGLGVNTDIQQFFIDNGITKISQLNGETSATDIKQIKLICTKSSIKFLKYGTFEEWKKIMLPNWGICKYEKPQSNFNGMVNTHYQLCNTLGLNFIETKELLNDTLEYIKLLNNDISVFKLHLKIIKAGGLDEVDGEELTEEEITELDSIKTNSDFVLSMLKINEGFIKTPVGRTFKYEVIENYKKNVDKGHILVTGTYATVVNSMYEYLLCSIGKWDGKSSTIGIGQCVTSKFKPLEDVLGVRSPQPTMSNMTVFQNQEAGILSKYFQTESENVIFISAIGWNICECLSSLDFDADACLITNQKLICSRCKAQENDMVTVTTKEIIDDKEVSKIQTIKRFLVSTDFTPKKKIPRSYTSEDLTDTDIKCAEGRLGECINFVQMLNSVYFTKKLNGASEEELLELFIDISSLNILSCIIIDSCKKLSPINISKEMDKISAKGYLGKGIIIRKGEKKQVGIRPRFFKYLDGGKDYKFIPFECGMDYLVQIMSDKKYNPDKNRDNENGNVTLLSLLIKAKGNKADRKKIQNIIRIVGHMQNEIKSISASKETGKEKFRQIGDIREIYFAEIAEKGITKEIVYTIIKRLSSAYTTKDKFQEYKKVGRNVLKVLYSIDPVKFLSCLQVKSDISGTIKEKLDGEIDIYGVKYEKILKLLP